MNRIAGIVIAVAGVLVAVLGIAKVVPGITSTGICLLLLGGLVFGLSFIAGPSAEDEPRMSTPSTLANIFFSPTEVFRNLRKHPRWLVAVLIMSVMSSVFLNLFLYRLTPERVTNYAIDKTLEMSFLNDQARAQIESGRQKAIEDSKNPVLRAGQATNSLVGQVFLFAFLGGVFLLCAAAMGGKINYWQAFSVAVYASFPIAVIKFLLNTLILFLKDPDDIHPITGQGGLIHDNLNFLIAPADHPVLYTLLGTLSLLWFYWIWLNATGLKNGGEKVSSSTAWTSTFIVYGIIILLGVVVAFLFPSFFS